MGRLIHGSETAVVEPTIVCMCGEPAQAFLQIHAADRCEESETASQFFCSLCLLTYLHVAQAIADSGSESCSTCGLDFVSLGDIVVRICHIDKR